MIDKIKAILQGWNQGNTSIDDIAQAIHDLYEQPFEEQIARMKGKLEKLDAVIARITALLPKPPENIGECMLSDEEILKSIWRTCYRNVKWDEFKRTPAIKDYERNIARDQLNSPKLASYIEAEKKKAFDEGVVKTTDAYESTCQALIQEAREEALEEVKRELGAETVIYPESQAWQSYWREKGVKSNDRTKKNTRRGTGGM